MDRKLRRDGALPSILLTCLCNVGGKGTDVDIDSDFLVRSITSSSSSPLFSSRIIPSSIQLEEISSGRNGGSTVLYKSRYGEAKGSGVKDRLR